MSADRLREMLSEATPSVDLSVADYRKGRDRLDALAPDAISLLADAAALIAKTTYSPEGYSGPDVWWKAEADEWAARLNALCGDER